VLDLKLRNSVLIATTCCVCGVSMAAAQTASTAAAPVPLCVRAQSLADAAVASGQVKGVAVGLVSLQARCTAFAGTSGNDARPNIDGDTLFEVASITKGFTGTLLADMVQRGELKLDDSIAQSFGGALPEPLRGNPSLDAVTWRQLATHTSGIARIPQSQWKFIKAMLQDMDDPYKHYAIEAFFEHLKGLKLAPTQESEYSNSGMALMGMLLAAKLGQPLASGYEAVLRKRVLTPLGMDDSHFIIEPANAARLAAGHDGKGVRTPHWTQNFWSPAGGLISSVNDMSKLLDAALAKREPLTMAQVQLVKRGEHGGVGMGWHLSRTKPLADKAQNTIAWHNGGTFGARSFVGMDVARGFGVVVLTNTGTADFADELGMHLWDPSKPEPSFDVLSKKWTMLAKVLLAVVLLMGVLVPVKVWVTKRLAAGRSIASRTSRLLPKPYLSKLDVALGGVYGAVAAAFIFKNLPPIHLPAALSGVHLVWPVVAMIGVAASYGLLQLKGLPIHHLHDRKTRWSTAWSVAITLLFIWILC
jgi:serine-type D-Ala-D-Ala carboxypeptidase/endopeptidase